MEALKLTNCGNYFLEHHDWPLEKRKIYGSTYDYLYSGWDILKAIRENDGYLLLSRLNSLEEKVADYERGMSFINENQFVETLEIKNEGQTRQQLSEEYESYPLKRLHRVIIELNYQCQFSCQHCFQGALERNKGLETEKIKETLDGVSLLGVPWVLFYGGEATLRKDFFEILEYTKGKFSGVYLVSNGFWENPIDIAEKLKQGGITSVTFTSCGYKEDADKFTGKEGSYKRLIASIKELRRRRIPHHVAGWVPERTPNRRKYVNKLLRLNHTIPLMFGSLEKKEKWLWKRRLFGENSFLIGNALNMDIKKKETSLDDIVDKVKEGCSVFHQPYFFVVRPTGQVSPCFYTISGNEFGNVKEDSFFSILNNIQNTTIYKHHSEKNLDSLLPLIDRNIFRFFEGSRSECAVFVVLNSIVTIKERLVSEGWEAAAAIKEANIITAKNLGFLKKNGSTKTN